MTYSDDERLAAQKGQLSNPLTSTPAEAWMENFLAAHAMRYDEGRAVGCVCGAIAPGDDDLPSYWPTDVDLDRHRARAYAVALLARGETPDPGPVSGPVRPVEPDPAHGDARAETARLRLSYGSDMDRRWE